MKAATTLAAAAKVVAALSAVAMADAFAPGASLRLSSGLNCRVHKSARSGPKFCTTTMQLGGGGLESLGGDRNTYVDRIQQLKDEISSGKRDGEVSNVDPRMITENEEVMFETINLPLQEDEVTRLKEASGKREDLVDAEQEEEEDAELELALLAMFVEQGDIDASSLPKTGKV